jgi:hypothetical protein
MNVKAENVTSSLSLVKITNSKKRQSFFLATEIFYFKNIIHGCLHG